MIDSKNASKPSVRSVAGEILDNWDNKTNSFVDELMDQHPSVSSLSDLDQRLLREILWGVFRTRRRLDCLIDQLAHRGIESLPAPVINILRVGLYQLDQLDRIPAYAVVNEAVRICGQGPLRHFQKMVNAMLRSYGRRSEELLEQIREHPNKLAIETSHPDWLVQWAIQRWGEPKAAVWLHSNNRKAAVHLQVMRQNLSPEYQAMDREGQVRVLTELLGGLGLPTKWGTVALPLGTELRGLPGYSEGWFFVQDPGAAQPVGLLEPKPGEVIYDLCSAPGGKTLQMADAMQGQGTLTSVDSNSQRIQRLEENLSRCRQEWVTVSCADLLAEPQPDWPMADGVLVDVPCSGLGTMRRHVDLRYRLSPRDFRELAEKATRLLAQAALLVRPGGRLVYSTCTLTLDENQDVVQDFLEQNRGVWKFRREKLSPSWLNPGQPVPQEEPPSCDGSYCALLERLG